jgi:chemotaxis protein methyltransferase CheR
MAYTFFFRDAQTLELAIDDALPSLRGRAFIHVWDAGRAHGPEPYKLAILLRERMRTRASRGYTPGAHAALS